MTTPHPAKYTDALLPTFAKLLRGCTRIYDPFGGTGKLFLLKHWLPDARFYGTELEPEWAMQQKGMVVGDALRIPFGDATFDGVCVSLVYGNRMSDRHQARDGSKRITYTHTLGRKLHEHNTGQLQWGKQYRRMHEAAWREVLRVLQVGGSFVLNCKDHYRDGKLQSVTIWHVDTLCSLGCTVHAWHDIPCPGMGFGQNGALRVEFESVILLVKE